MALYHRKRFQAPGLPEFIVLMLIVCVVVSATCWWCETRKPELERTVGTVIACDITKAHYNAQPYQKKVSIKYEYSVGAGDFTGDWTGFWPSMHSPNALSPDNLEVLRQSDYPLVVLYDPGNPSDSRLHNPKPERAFHLTMLTFSLGAVFVVYCVWIYPRWKLRRQTRW